MTAPSTRIRARVAICVLEDDDGRVLLLRRAADRSLGAGLWGFPAGHMEPGENAAVCALRELAEEIGSEHELTDIAHLGPVRDRHYGGQYEVYLFHYHWHSGLITLNAEHTDYAWVTPGRCLEYPIMPGIHDNLIGLGLLPGENPYA